MRAPDQAPRESRLGAYTWARSLIPWPVSAVLRRRRPAAPRRPLCSRRMLACLNFRDVGEWLTLLAGRELLPPRRLLRGGKLDAVGSAAEILEPGTIINLRMGPDRDSFGAEPRHVAIPNAIEKYDTTDREVRRWLNAVADAVAAAPRLPVLLHCTSGKDRTGVAVAVLLLALDVPRSLVVDEFLLSDNVARADIERALDGIGEVAAYLDRIDLPRLRARLIG